MVCTALSACWLTSHVLLERTSTMFLEEKQTVFLGDTIIPTEEL